MIDSQLDNETVSNTADSTPQPTTAPTAIIPTNQTPVQTQTQPVTTQQLSQSQQQPYVSNAPQTQPANPANDPNAHPAIKRAGLLRSIAETLAGGPRVSETINPDGSRSVTQIPLSGRQIGVALALEAIGGSLAGLSVSGPNNLGRAAAAGFAQGQQQQQTIQQRQDQQAQQDFQNQSKALAQKASTFEANSRVILNTAQAERYGLDNLKDAVAQSAKLLADYQDQGAVQETNVPQDQLLAGLQSGKYNATQQIAVPDGFASLNGRWEQTFAIVTNPSAKVPLTNAQAQEYADNDVPGFAAFKDGKNKIPDGFAVSGTIVARANQQVAANKLMLQDVNEVTTALAKSDDKGNQELANQIPSFKSLLDDPKQGTAFQLALERFQKYVSHSDWHGRDIYESLQQMAAPSVPDPNNPKAYVPNPDARFATTIAGAFGNGDPNKGWAILKAYHDEVVPEQITNEAQAADMLASSAPGSRAAKYAQRWIASNTAQKAAIAGADAKARARAANESASASATSGQPDALGFTPNVAGMGGVKEYNKKANSFKKNLDDLARTEASYQQFASTLGDLASGKGMTGAASVVGLFNAIGLSAVPLAGRGFRITENTIKEHQQARGWGQALQAKLLGAKNGDVITPQQLKDYATIAMQARQSQYVNLANELHSVGLSADPALPTGNGQKIDPATARIFLTLTGNDPNKARAAATAKGWQF